MRHGDGGLKMCEYCQQRRDDNEDLIYTRDCFTQIRYKDNEYRLYTVNAFIRIKYCPMCGRKLESEETE